MTSRTLAGVLLVPFVLAGCGADAGEQQTLTVFAAASLREPFTEIGEDFETDHPDVSVTFNFAGSSDLVAQLQQGAPADVFASADTATMDKAADDGLVESEPVDFATNTLQIATPPDNPAGVETLEDLARGDVTVVLCAPEVPCGAAARSIQETSGVDIEPVSEEQSVTDVLGKVTSGEADAGLVYVTDVIAAGDAVKGITFPESSEAVNTYPMAALADAEQAELAQQLIDLVTGTEGRRVLQAAGFTAP